MKRMTSNFISLRLALLSCAVLICSLVPNYYLAQFTEIPTPFIGVTDGDLAWGDYDNDGDLDLLLTGDGNNDNKYTELYRNEGGGVFVNIVTGVQPVDYSSVCWADYDNDNDLDIVLTGRDATSLRVSKTYTNNGAGQFTEAANTLIGIAWGHASLGDLNNNGALDMLIIGRDNNDAFIAKIYNNDGINQFTDTYSGIIGGGNSSSANNPLGDYDNDGDLDILLSGNSPVGVVSKIYINENDYLFTDAQVGLPGLQYGAGTWGDYDNDGDLDILLTGAIVAEFQALSVIYRNDGSGVFTNINAGLTGIIWGAYWGDYDNDGDLDVLLSGINTDENSAVKLYRNDGADTFTEVTTQIADLGYGMAAWGDYDNDGDLDLVVSGYSDVSESCYTKLYRNDILPANTPPNPPTNLTTSVSESDVIFQWNEASDAQTPTPGLNYNIRIGTTPGGNQVFSSMSSVSGFRKVVSRGISNASSGWKMKLSVFETNTAYYWSVQAIDSSYKGSAFAPEQVYHHTTENSDSTTPGTQLVVSIHPNPFVEETTVSYKLPQSAQAELSIYNIRGQLVRKLVNEPLTSGQHTVTWDGKDDNGKASASGMYLCRISSAGKQETHKMLLMK